MPNPSTALQILDEQFLSVRAKLIEVAATLDRLDRAAACETPSTIVSDPRVEQIQGAVKLLLESGPGRAEQIQLHFSLPYDEKTA